MPKPNVLRGYTRSYDGYVSWSARDRNKNLFRDSMGISRRPVGHHTTPVVVLPLADYRAMRRLLQCAAASSMGVGQEYGIPSWREWLMQRDALIGRKGGAR